MVKQPDAVVLLPHLLWTFNQNRAKGMYLTSREVDAACYDLPAGEVKGASIATSAADAMTVRGKSTEENKE